MKKALSILVVLFIAVCSVEAQETDFKPNGSPTFKVFWNYHTDLTKDATKTSAFELKRAYLGYKYAFSEKISAKLTLDVGSNSGGSSYTAFLKAAQLDWKVSSGVKLSMGLIGMKQWNDQEKFWGYRYMFKSFQDQHKFGSSADLGVNAEFKLSKTLTANFLIANGEGYKKIQDSNGYQKFGANLVFKPVKGLITKIYVDTHNAEDSKAISNMALFAGYQVSSWRLGMEFNKLSNATKYSSPAEDHNLDGFSVYSTYAFSKKVEIFGRYDQLGSNKVDGDAQVWNYNKDGSQIIFGLQVAPIKGLTFALNYQGYSYDNSSIDTNSKVFLNAEFKL
jgi:hypothetical protein